VCFLYFRNEEGVCEYADSCVKAHGSDELEEWYQRIHYREAKLRLFRQNNAVDLTYQNVTEFRSDVEGAEVVSDQPFEVHLTEKTANFSWNFHIQV